MSKRQVPELSLLSYVNGTTQDQIKFVDDIMFGLKEYGFIILKDHTIEQNDLNNINIYLTKKDEVLNFDKSLVFLQKIYPKAKIVELDNGKYPHHLMVPSVSDEALIIKNNL